MKPHQTVTCSLAFHGLLLSKYIWCFDKDVKMEDLVLIKGVGGDIEQFEWRWNTVGDETEHRIRVEGIIFIEGRARDLDIVELIRPEVNDVRLRVLVQLGSFDEDVGSSSERCVIHTFSCFRIEETGLGLLQSLFSVPNTIKIVSAATCFRQVSVKRQLGCKNKRSCFQERKTRSSFLLHQFAF